jgi:hypothetical protein
MANRIGPSFAQELRAAGVSDFRFSWTLDTGKIEFHPEVPAEERAKVEAVLAAHDGALSEARHQALEASSAEAAKRIAEPFFQPPGSQDLIFTEINALGRAVEIILKIIDGTALPEERADLDVLRGIYSRTQAILEARSDAKRALLAAKDVGEVEKVRPAWPAD